MADFLESSFGYTLEACTPGISASSHIFLYLVQTLFSWEME